MRIALNRLALAAVLLPLAPLPALALSATAASTVNIRSGPGPDFAVVSKLQAGDVVDVSKCQGTFCLITHGTASGWVSASFLTRDNLPKPAPATVATVPAASATPQPAAGKPAAPQTATAKPAPLITAPTVKPVLPQVAASPAKPAASSQPTTITAKPAPLPQLATAKPGLPQPLTGKPAAAQVAVAKPVAPRPLPPASAGTATSFPPAYDAGNAPIQLLDGNQAPDVADIGVPRPRVDVPFGALSGPDDEDPSQGFDVPAPTADDYYRGAAPRGDGFVRPHRRRDWSDYAELGAGDACFLAGGRSAFCLAEGESLSDLGRWSGIPLDLRNPDGLPVTVCTGPGRDCQLYQSSAPLVVDVGDDPVTIRVGGLGR